MRPRIPAHIHLDAATFAYLYPNTARRDTGSTLAGACFTLSPQA
jgi:hypothetical protein